MCPLVIEMRKHSAIEAVVCVTGQHREMLQQVLDAFGVILMATGRPAREL